MVANRGFDFDAGTMIAQLEVFDKRVSDFIDEDVAAHVKSAETTMKTKAPWRDHTGEARRTLWATGDRVGGNVHFELGHGKDYGIYLERNNERRFAIVDPTIKALGKSFMRSMERLFAQIQVNAPPTSAIAPEISGTRPNTTRETTDRRGQTRWRNERGQFISGTEAKRRLTNAARRARYAARKAAGTLPTRRTRRG